MVRIGGGGESSRRTLQFQNHTGCGGPRRLGPPYFSRAKPNNGDEGQDQRQDAVEDSMFGQAPIAGGLADAKISSQDARARESDKKAKFQIAAIEKIRVEF